MQNILKYTYKTRTQELKRVVVTGLGTVNPLGVSVNQSWDNLINQQSGIIRLKSRKQFEDNPSFPDVNMAPIHEDFDPKKFRVAFSTNNLNSFTMAAAQEAIIDSNLTQIIDKSDENLKLRTGVNIGTMSSNVTKLTDILLDAGQKGFDKINRMTILHVLTNMPTANVAIKYNLKGPSATSSTACATGASAIGDSFKKIQYGNADIMIAGGSEDSVCPTNIQASLKLQAMSNKQYDSPCQSSRPFDQDRSGFILAEGSGVLVLEELQHALDRNAKIYCEVMGYGQSSDGYHLTRPLEDGDGALRAMQNAIKDSGLNKQQINHINCHATSTPTGDTAEVFAIQNLFNNNIDQLKNVTIAATKSQIGHTFGAAGAIESIFTILSLKNKISPAIKNLENPIENSLLNFTVKNNIQQENMQYAIKNAFGFGGVNASLVFGNYKQDHF